jgi:4-amino-4-deoxy-L-arabinose transferase-like glycosyltransferase
MRQTPPPHRWIGFVLPLVAVGAYALILGYWATIRGVNQDEGFYIRAGVDVLQGQRLYADVFYPQMPYLPWAEAALFDTFGVSLLTARALSVLASAFSAGLVVLIVWRQSRSVLGTLLALLLFAASGVMLNGLAVAKTYGLANLFMLAGLALLLNEKGGARWHVLAAGLALGAAIGVRLPVAAVTPIFAFLAWQKGKSAAILFLAAMGVASLPWVVMAIQAPDHFWFCNVTFHVLRREMVELSAILWQKAGVVAKWLFFPQHLIVWILAGAGFWLAPRKTWAPALCVLLLAAVYAATTPTYVEYATQFFPLLLVVAGPALARLSERPAAGAVIGALYLLTLYPAVRSTPEDSPLAAKRKLWARETIAEVSAFVRDHTEPSDPVLSWWEGFPALSGRPGINGVGFWQSNVAKKLDAETAQKYHVTRQEQLRRLLRERYPAAVVVAEGQWKRFRPLLEDGYQQAHEVHGIEIFLRRPS